MMDASRHKSVDTLRGYVRRVDLFKEHAGAAFLQGSPTVTGPTMPDSDGDLFFPIMQELYRAVQRWTDEARPQPGWYGWGR